MLGVFVLYIPSASASVATTYTNANPALQLKGDSTTTTSTNH